MPPFWCQNHTGPLKHKTGPSNRNQQTAITKLPRKGSKYSISNPCDCSWGRHTEAVAKGVVFKIDCKRHFTEAGPFLGEFDQFPIKHRVATLLIILLTEKWLTFTWIKNEYLYLTQIGRGGRKLDKHKIRARKNTFCDENYRNDKKNDTSRAA